LLFFNLLQGAGIVKKGPDNGFGIANISIS